MRHFARTSWLALALAAAACTSTVAPDLPSDGLPLNEQVPTPGLTARRVASILDPAQPGAIDVPATARAGEAITVGVTTFGGGCIREDTTVVTVRGSQAEVVPYQLVYTPKQNEACTLEARVTPRRVRITFATAGSAAVVIRGRTSLEGDPATIVRGGEGR